VSYVKNVRDKIFPAAFFLDVKQTQKIFVGTAEKCIFNIGTEE